MMTMYDYQELFNNPPVIVTPDEEYLEWVKENCPLPTNEELSNLYEQINEGE